MADLSQIKVKATADGVDCREIIIDTNRPYQDQFIEYSQLDSGSRFLKITYCIGGRVKNFTNLNTARLFLFKQVDGTNIIDDCYVDPIENCIWCELPIQALILVGTDDLGFLVDEYNPTSKTTSAIISSTFHAKVNKCVVSSEVTTSPEYTAFTNGLQNMDTYMGRITLLENSVGDVTLLNTTDKTNLVNAINELNNNKLNKTGDASNTTVAFTQAITLANVVTGEKSSTLIGKIAKAIDSLISHLSNVSNPHSVTKLQVGLGNCDNIADANKSVLSATKWTTARTLSLTDDVTGSASIDGSLDKSISVTLANSGVTANTYKSVTVNAKGLVTGGTNPTTLAGYGITDATPSSHVGSTGSAHGLATASVNGFMSSTDKTKLDSLPASSISTWIPTFTDATYTTDTYSHFTYYTLGKLVFFSMRCNVTSTVNGAFSFTLPVNATANLSVVLSCMAGTGTYKTSYISGGTNTKANVQTGILSGEMVNVSGCYLTA